MFITKINNSSGIKIQYVQTTTGISEVRSIQSKELARPEFRLAIIALIGAFQSIPNTIAPQENSALDIYSIDIHYSAQTLEAVGFRLKGDMKRGDMTLTFQTEEISIGLCRELTNAVRKVVIEAEKYVRGERAQGELFDRDEEPGTMKAVK